ncbi:hypothetical protein HOLleu_29718 [Holothuria leucospilota]|uniref:Uncharacterized protein n=1 Tax=Holothuria leucospilota TaxID=206669 RepID=A0A9Q1BJC4_HOLLE|nr:hypothetical protein HOLleu_29718 [Holothuria leucospilota]
MSVLNEECADTKVAFWQREAMLDMQACVPCPTPGSAYGGPSDHSYGSRPDTHDVKEQIGSGTTGTSGPTQELVTFDGSPENFWTFRNSFRTNIEGKCLDDRTRLTYLIQFCTGKARKSIENCILMQPGEGYAMAKMILADQFGQNYMASKVLLNKVLNREP